MTWKQRPIPIRIGRSKKFVERTGVSSLAIAIGTAHGFYAGTPVLDKERVSKVKEVVSVPLVLTETRRATRT